ncbi:uncharacterized protein [Littorina saxatilis]|uniref:RING-type domain-containing protein n=1 Tax=Littorina saxatilis TaxID=31220 RepID=A0AAN9AN65_9CAEN
MNLLRKLPFFSKERGERGGRDGECAICQDVPRDPRTLPCGNRHVFCLACLEGLVRHNDDDRNTFPCPLCRRIVNIPVGGLTALTEEKDFWERAKKTFQALRFRWWPRQSPSSLSSSDDALESTPPYWDHLDDGSGFDAASLFSTLEGVPPGRLDGDTLFRQNGTLEDSLNPNNDVNLDAIDVQLQMQILEDIELEQGARRNPDSPGFSAWGVAADLDNIDFVDNEVEDIFRSMADHHNYWPNAEEDDDVLAPSDTSRHDERGSYSIPTHEYYANTPGDYFLDSPEDRVFAPVPEAVSDDLDMSVVRQVIADIDRNSYDEATRMSSARRRHLHIGDNGRRRSARGSRQYLSFYNPYLDMED